MYPLSIGPTSGFPPLQLRMQGLPKWTLSYYHHYQSFCLPPIQFLTKSFHTKRQHYSTSLHLIITKVTSLTTNCAWNTFVPEQPEQVATCPFHLITIYQVLLTKTTIGITKIYRPGILWLAPFVEVPAAIRPLYPIAKTAPLLRNEICPGQWSVNRSWKTFLQHLIDCMDYTNSWCK